MKMKRILLLIICLANAFYAFSQTNVLRGKVIDATGLPLPGVSVKIKSTNISTSTNAEGQFSLQREGGIILTVSAIGFATKEVNVSASEQQVEVALETSLEGLDEVVVTALGIKRDKRQLTYSTQQVTGEVLTSTKEPSVLNALAGRVSGLQITSSSGQPGSSSRIVLRGVTSISNDNEALIIMDGVPINNSQTGNAGPGNGISRMSDIDPEIIESINVLKGSAASALYGSAAARGVVMITTKNGVRDTRPQINFSSQVSAETPILPQIQSLYAQGSFGQYTDGEASKTSEVWGPRIDTLLVGGQPVYNRNPLEEFFQTGITTTNTLSAGGGAGKSSYFLSYSYLDQKGTVPTSKLRRHTVFAKFSNEITSKIKADFQLNYSNHFTNRVPEGWDIISPIWTVYTMPFTWNPYPIYDESGEQRVFRFSRNNPYWSLDNAYNESMNNRFMPVASFVFTPLSWLTVTERVGADIYQEQNKYYESPSTFNGTTGRIDDRNNAFRQYNHDLIIDMHKQFGEDFDVNVLLGNNILTTNLQTYAIDGRGVTIVGFDNISNASTITASQTNNLRRKVGFYGQANVEYKRFLNLSLTGRYDGSSVLDPEKNFYTYGSASAGLVFSELIKVPAINFGKLRVSYSNVGNDNIGAYNTSTVFSTPTSPSNFPYDGVSGFAQSSTLANPRIRNESTSEFEVGLEMQFLNRRLGFEGSYFYRNGTDLLSSSVGLSAATGYTATVLNANSMTNRGVELMLNANPVRSEKFSWDLTGVFTRIKNEVTNIYGNTPFQSIGQTYAMVGQPYGVIYNIGFRTDEQGRQIVDSNGLPLGTTSNVVLGNIQPDWTAGFTNNFRFGDLSFGFFFDMRKGGDLINQDDAYGFFYGTAKVTENRENLVVAGVHTDGTVNTTEITARDYYQRLNAIPGAAIQDATYVKLRNANITYNFSRNVLDRTPFSKLSLTLTGRNLWIYSPNFTGADPEVSSFGTSNGSQGVYTYSVPTSRSYNLTLNVTFK